MAQYTGKIAWFSNAKGFGFLKPENGADMFVHYSALQMEGYKSLKENEVVEFDVIVGSAGKPQAENVRSLTKGTAG